MVPRLDEEIRKPPTGTAEARVDSSIAYKDAAYALLTNEGGPLISDKAEVETMLDGSGFASVFALATFLALASGVFIGLFKMSRRWENEVPH